MYMYAHNSCDQKEKCHNFRLRESYKIKVGMIALCPITQL